MNTTNLAAEPIETAPELPKKRNDAVTVQIDHTSSCLVNTAMATNIGTREYQQDAAYVCEPLYGDGLAFGILCDGMGGMTDGERVSSDVVAFIANRIANLPLNQDIPSFLEKSVVDANEMVLQNNLQSGKESGTTLVSALILRDGLNWVSVGDSRIYILRKGEIVQVTRDHNFYLELQKLVEAGRITQQQADTDPRKDALVSYIGAPSLDWIDLNRGTFALQYGDIILLCSDGLTKALSDEKIQQLIAQHGNDIFEAARILPLAAFDESPNGLDNTSVILMQYFGSAQCTE